MSTSATAVEKKKKVFTKREIEGIGSDFFRILQKRYPNMDTFDMAMIMLYASAFVAHSASPTKELRNIGAMSHYWLTNSEETINSNEKKDATVSVEKQTSEVSGSSGEVDDPARPE